MNKWRPLAVIASIVAISGVPAMHADGAQYQVLRAANVHELIADMIIAAHSGQPTQIRLAQGHYTFSSAYSVAFDGSYLPEVIENLQIIGSDASKTVLETDQSSTTPLLHGRQKWQPGSIQGDPVRRRGALRCE